MRIRVQSVSLLLALLLGSAGTGLSDTQAQSLQSYEQAEFDIREATALAFSPTRPFLAVGSGDGWLRVYDVDAGRMRLETRFGRDPITGLVFAPDGAAVFAATERGALGALDLLAGEVVREGSADFRVLSLDMDPTGNLLLVGGEGGNVRVVATSNFQTRSQFSSPNLYRKEVWHVAFGMDGSEVAAFGEEGRSAFWAIGQDEPLRQGELVNEDYRAIARDPSGRLLALGTKRLTRTRNASSGGRLTVVSENRVDLFSWDRGRSARTIDELPADINAVVASPDRSFVIVGLSDGTVEAHSATENRRLTRIHEGEQDPTSMAFSADGSWLAAAFVDEVRVWAVSGTDGTVAQGGRSADVLQALDPAKYEFTTSREPLISAVETVGMAVLGLDNRGVEADLAAAVGDLVSTQLANVPNLDLAERGRVDELLEELAFQQDGFTTPEEAAQLGRMLNAERIVFGAVNRFGSTLAITLRLVGTESGRIEGAREIHCKSCAPEDLPMAVRLLAGSLVEIR